MGWQCLNCGRGKKRYYILWANQHGRMVRYFCECGTWTDVRTIGNEQVSTRMFKPGKERKNG